MQLIIKTNVSHTSEVLVSDIPWPIPASGGSVTLEDRESILIVENSVSLLPYLTDDLYGVNSSTLILNNGVTDIAQADLNNFLGIAHLPSDPGHYSLVTHDYLDGEIEWAHIMTRISLGF